MISIDRVFQTVNVLLDKNGGKWLTQQEFNLFATKAQIDVFEGEFYDLKNALAQGIGMGSDWGDIADNIRDKIQIFEEFAELPVDAVTLQYPFPANYYRLTSLYWADTQNSLPRNIEEVSHGKLPFILQSPLTTPTITSPIYVWQSNRAIVYPAPTGTQTIFAAYVRRPVDPMWIGTVLNGTVIYDSTNSVDFEVHYSNLPELIVHILSYAGIVLSRADVVNFAQGEEQQIQQSEQ